MDSLCANFTFTFTIAFVFSFLFHVTYGFILNLALLPFSKVARDLLHGKTPVISVTNMSSLWYKMGAVSPRKIHLHLSGYVLMKWTLKTHSHKTCDIPDPSALVALQANRTCQWDCLFFLLQSRERQAIKSNWSPQQCWDLRPRRPRRSERLIII